jgi:hypothetical protein
VPDPRSDLPTMGRKACLDVGGMILDRQIYAQLGTIYALP